MKQIHSRKTLLMIPLIAYAFSIHAQGLGEWFNQKKTQTKYLIQQIVALQVYLGYLEKGYHITKDGLHLIGDIKDGEFNLHKHYFNSLKTVNPLIMKYPKVAGILSMQSAMLDQYYTILRAVKSDGQFTSPEITYIKKIYDNLLDEAGKDLDELQLVITSGKMEMTDDERIEKIDGIYKQMQDKYSFSEIFSKRILQLAAIRKQQKANAKVLNQLYKQQ